MELAADVIMELEKEGGSKKNELYDLGTLVFKGRLKPAIEVPKNISLVMRTRTPLKCRESKIVLDSRFHVMDPGFQALNSSL